MSIDMDVWKRKITQCLEYLLDQTALGTSDTKRNQAHSRTVGKAQARQDRSLASTAKEWRGGVCRTRDFAVITRDLLTTSRLSMKILKNRGEGFIVLARKNAAHDPRRYILRPSPHEDMPMARQVVYQYKPSDAWLRCF
jgi:hypothetical protein